MASSTERIDVGGSPMEVYVSLPDRDGPFAAIVVAQHAGGVDEFIRTMCDRLAEAGYAAAAPHLYHRLEDESQGTPRSLVDAEMIADVEATVALLQGRDDVDGERLGVTGFCMGGRVVYLMAAAVPAFKAAVAYYGGNIRVALGGEVSPFERSPEIGCPLMFHFGDDDGNPSPEDRESLDAELTRLGKEHEFHHYAGAGHAFMSFGGPRYSESADTASWPRSLEFFGRHLGA